MTTERQAYAQFLALRDSDKYLTIADIINRNAQHTFIDDWTEKDADIILALATEKSPAQPLSAITPRKLLDDYLENPSVILHLQKDATDRDLTENVKKLVERLKTNTLEKLPNHFIEHLRTRFPVHPVENYPYNTRAKQIAHQAAISCGIFGRRVGHILWKDRNHAQRAGEIIAPIAVTAAILGAVTGKSAALTTAGTAIAKILPGFVAAFGVSHAIPPAALAFYVIAAVLGATALALLIAGTAKQGVNLYKDTRPTYVSLHHHAY